MNYLQKLGLMLGSSRGLLLPGACLSLSASELQGLLCIDEAGEWLWQLSGRPKQSLQSAGFGLG